MIKYPYSKPEVTKSDMHEVNKVLQGGYLSQGEKIQEFEFKLSKDFKSQNIAIASMSVKYSRKDCDSFIFKKTAKSSQDFIKLLKSCDLVICADSAPLHIANALKKDVIAFFNSTSPETVINSGDKLRVYRNE